VIERLVFKVMLAPNIITIKIVADPPKSSNTDVRLALIQNKETSGSILANASKATTVRTATLVQNSNSI